MKSLIFGILIFSLVGNIPALEIIVVDGDLNGHEGGSMDRYEEEVRGGYNFGERNVEYHVKSFVM